LAPLSYHEEMNIALIAHDHKKDDMVQLAQEFTDFLSRCRVMATGTTGGRLHVEVGLAVECMLSGPMGGDLQIGARLAEGQVDAVVFLRDPMTPQPHEPDINALVRACDVHNVPCATNVAGGRLLLAELSRRETTPPKRLESALPDPGSVCAVPVSAPPGRG
jgi:methylglyoxal synthase